MKRIILLLSLAIALNSCQSNDGLSYDKLIEVNNTHVLKPTLESTVDKITKDTVSYSDFKYPVILVIVMKQNLKYEVCISKTDYKIFKGARPETFNKLKGFTHFKKLPVLLFGDIDNSFFINEENKLPNILGKPPVYDIDNPPIVYEPKMLCKKYNLKF